MRLGYRGIHDLAVLPGAGGQFDDIPVGIAEINQAHKAMVNRPAHLPALGLRPLQHGLESVVFDAERDMEVERILPLELERRTRHLKKREARSIVHLEK